METRRKLSVVGLGAFRVWESGLGASGPVKGARGG